MGRRPPDETDHLERADETNRLIGNLETELHESNRHIESIANSLEYIRGEIKRLADLISEKGN